MSVVITQLYKTMSVSWREKRYSVTSTSIDSLRSTATVTIDDKGEEECRK